MPASRRPTKRPTAARTPAKRAPAKRAPAKAAPKSPRPKRRPTPTGATPEIGPSSANTTTSPQPARALPVGRPCKLTSETHELIVEAIRAGNYQADAARLADVHPDTLRRWMADGRTADEGPFRALYAAVKKAEAEAKAENVALIQLAARSTWQAAAWYLERKYPHQFARQAPQKHEHAGPGGAPIPHTITVAFIGKRSS